MNKVTMDLRHALAMMNPPPDILTVAEYKAFISALFTEIANETTTGRPSGIRDRGPGRPLVYGHPAWSDAEFKAIKEHILTEYVQAYPSEYGNAKGFAKEQPVEQNRFRLDNGKVLEFSDIHVSPAGDVGSLYPPAIVEE